MVGFESIFEKFLCLGELCNDSRLYKNAYKVFDFLKIFHVLKVFSIFEKMFNLKMDCEQATKNILPTQNSFVHFSLPLILLFHH